MKRENRLSSIILYNCCIKHGIVLSICEQKKSQIIISEQTFATTDRSLFVCCGPSPEQEDRDRDECDECILWRDWWLLSLQLSLSLTRLGLSCGTWLTCGGKRSASSNSNRSEVDEPSLVIGWGLVTTICGGFWSLLLCLNLNLRNR